MGKAGAVSYERLAACAKREVRYRKRVYWHRVAEGRMTLEQAEEEIACMEAMFEHFDALANPRLL
jgi:hypothetical protein